MDERTALVALLLRSQSGWRDVVAEVLEAGSARTVLSAHDGGQQALFSVEESPGDELVEAEKLITACEKDGVGVHGFLDSSYPAQLRQVHEMPPVVFTRGQRAADQRAIAVVGSRRASDHGLSTARRIAECLVGLGVTVVSGLAEGIDTAAHTAALGAGGRTVAVLGTGINRVYPTRNRELQETIAQRGLVLSQFLPDAPPSKHSFPMRNAVMSGYAAATVIVQAGERSGARTQARFALRHGRPVIFPQELLVNQWAQEFAQHPGVHVVAGLSELATTVEQVIHEPVAPQEGQLQTADIAW
ncbi:DNA-processing protein DprA [Lipingzhangella sp. LS1_29]|uniref:DNA-processing protein DprA n=2 Tax=Lipingzhangella rawalii TaxID=2055835 RepID=A0ABU2H7D3_9ACTN|nr:DNA-processing protein DprA [Lipingzhangella rawalii]